MSAGGGLAARLARGERVVEPVALVVAHPDDETLGLGSRLHLFERLRLVLVTDGAPADHPDRAAYAAIRARELDAALERLGVRAERRAYGLVDQQAADHLPALTRRLAGDLADSAAVVTHAYEGGHPDHDACAFGVARAAAALGAAAPERWEFASYFGEAGVLRHGRLPPDPSRPETGWTLTAAERARKAAAFAAHASQEDVLRNFPPKREAMRRTPDYDWSRPPPPGEALYDRYGWAITSARWRERAAAALAGGC